MPQLTETEINIRKQSLEGDLQTVKDSLNKLDTERSNLVAQHHAISCLLYTSPSPRDMRRSRMPSSA